MTTNWVPCWDDSFQPVPISRLKEMYAAGYRVWARYVGPGSAAKHWTKAEITAWFALGPDTGVAMLAEGVGDEAINNPGLGDDHGREALAAMRALGVPAGVLCSPAVDRNINLTQTRGPVETYFRNWTKGFGAKGVAYVEVENGGRMVADGVTAATFTVAAYSWNESGKLITPANAPSHVVMTQEHNGKSMAGGSVDTGHCRVDAPHVWWNPAGAKGSATTGEDMSTMQVTVPQGYDIAGQKIDADDALSIIMRYTLAGYKAAVAASDPKALAAELVPLLVAKLPAQGGALTQDQIEAALRAVFADAAAPPAS